MRRFFTGFCIALLALSAQSLELPDEHKRFNLSSSAFIFSENVDATIDNLPDRPIFVENTSPSILLERNQSFLIYIDIKKNTYDWVLSVDFVQKKIPFDVKLLNIKTSEVKTIPSTGFSHGISYFLTLEENQDYRLFVQGKTADIGGNVNVYAQPVTDYISMNLYEILFYGIIFGVLLGLGVYNFFIFIKIKKLEYLAFVSFLISIMLLIFYNEDLALILFNKDLEWLILSAEACLISASWFVITFLKIKKYSPGLYKILSTVIVCDVLVVFIYLLFNAEFILVLTEMFIPATAIIGLYGAVQSIRKGFSPAKYFISAWLVTLIAASYLSLISLNLVPGFFHASKILYVGASISAVLFSLALASYISMLISKTQTLNLEKLMVEKKTNKLKDAFLSTISHELRTPLNGASGAIALLEAGGAKEQYPSEITTAHNAVDELGRLIDKILRFSELKAGAIALNSDPVNLNRLLANIVAPFEQQSRDKSLVCISEFDFSENCLVASDQEMLTIALNEILRNALNFTEHGQISIKCSISKNELTILVSDTGKGMTPEQVDRAFDLMDQAKSEFTRMQQGLGLGLALCREIVLLMDGNLQIHSTLGRGTNVEIILPILLVEAPTIRKEANQPSVDKKSAISVLIVEDVLPNQMILKKLLNHRDIEASCCSDGKQAVDLCQTMSFDLILMDLQMPIMDGFEATERIRALEREQGKDKAHIVALTANVMRQDEIACYEAGMNRFVKKPITRLKIDEILSFLMH